MLSNGALYLFSIITAHFIICKLITAAFLRGYEIFSSPDQPGENRSLCSRTPALKGKEEPKTSCVLKLMGKYILCFNFPTVLTQRCTVIKKCHFTYAFHRAGGRIRINIQLMHFCRTCLATAKKERNVGIIGCPCVSVRQLAFWVELGKKALR